MNPTGLSALYGCNEPDPCWTAGLLANLTCLQAELYEMEYAMSVGEDPLWIIPYTTIAVQFQDLLDDYTTYTAVSSLLVYHHLRKSLPPVFGPRSMHVSTLFFLTRLWLPNCHKAACKMLRPSHVNVAEVVKSLQRSSAQALGEAFLALYCPHLHIITNPAHHPSCS